MGSGERKGVGEENPSIALDAHHGGVKCAGTALVTVPQLTIQAGSVLTCERTSTNYRWLVDGVEKANVLVDSIANTSPGNGMRSSMQGAIKPFISAMGEWRVTQFTYYS